MVTTSFQLTDRNLILTGYTEPNKTRIALQVAEQLKMPFINVEERIEERLGGALETVRYQFGEHHIKTVEAEVMEQVMLYRNAVIRVNGSTLMHSEHYERLRQTGVVICLVARLDAILQRLHLMLGARYHDPAERGMHLGQLRREWAVRQLPDLLELDTTYLDEAQIVQAVMDIWQQIALERT